MVEYEEVKEDLYECLGKNVHDTVVYLKEAGYGEEFDGSDIAPLKAQAKEDHKTEFPELYIVEEEEI